MECRRQPQGLQRQVASHALRQARPRLLEGRPVVGPEEAKAAAELATAFRGRDGLLEQRWTAPWAQLVWTLVASTPVDGGDGEYVRLIFSSMAQVCGLSHRHSGWTPARRDQRPGWGRWQRIVVLRGLLAAQAATHRPSLRGRCRQGGRRALRHGERGTGVDFFEQFGLQRRPRIRRARKLHFLESVPGGLELSCSLYTLCLVALYG